MKLFTTTVVTLSLAGQALAGLDMDINFPGFLRTRQSTNLQTFTSALGGASADPITQSSDPKRPFSVDGSTFTDFKSAASRSCSNQKNACASIANSKKSSSLTVGDCDDQQSKCNSNISSAAAAASGQEQGQEQAQTQSTTSTTSTTSIATTSIAPPAQVQASTAVLSVPAAEPTLHSSDESFFYFCDP